MASQANITLNDGQVAPVAHTFVAAGVDGKGVAKWIEKTTETSPIGHFVLTTQTRLPSKAGDPVRHTYKMVIPRVVTETINGVSTKKVARQALVAIDVVMPSDSTTQERKDACAFLQHAMGAWTTSGQFSWQIVEQEPVV